MDTASYAEDAAYSQTIHRSFNDKTIANSTECRCCCRQSTYASFVRNYLQCIEFQIYHLVIAKNYYINPIRTLVFKIIHIIHVTFNTRYIINIAVDLSRIEGFG